MEKCPFQPETKAEARSGAAVALQRLVMRLVWMLKDKLHLCAHAGCWRKGRACYMPDLDGPAEWVCGEHAHAAGYCWSCGQFNAGIESFDFRRNGLCDNCNYSVRAEMGEFDEPQEDYDA